MVISSEAASSEVKLGEVTVGEVEVEVEGESGNEGDVEEKKKLGENASDVTRR